MAHTLEQCAAACRRILLTPGTAGVYNAGDLHRPRRSGPMRLIRLEGVTMDNVRRLRYKAV